MSNTPESSTSATLIGRLKASPTDERAWQEFVQRYGPKVHAWARQKWPRDQDAEDVTQKVFEKLLRAMQTFRYDKTRSFRGWLRAVVRSVASDFNDEVLPAYSFGVEESQRIIDSAKARDELERLIERQYDLELFEEACVRVRARVDPSTWDVFRQLHFEGNSAEEVARQTGIAISMVYAKKSRVVALLKKILENLDERD
jgi:RNA polymerase sigma factor (sigma-70 family)